MAFQIDKEHKTITLKYFRILQVNVNENGSGRIAIAGYRSESERDNDPTNHYEVKGYPVDQEAYHTYFEPSVLDASGNNRVQQAYEWLRDEHSEEWGNATDV